MLLIKLAIFTHTSVVCARISNVNENKQRHRIPFIGLEDMIYVAELSTYDSTSKLETVLSIYNFVRVIFIIII